MESESSAKHILSLFSSSKLESFNPASSRIFYQPSPPTLTAEDNAHEQHAQAPARKRRRRSQHAGEWKCDEIRTLKMYTSLIADGDEVNDTARAIFLPDRTNEAVKLQLARIKQTIRERRGSKLLELQKEEEEVRVQEMLKDIQRRKRGLDDVLGLDPFFERKNEEDGGDFTFRAETQTLRQKGDAKDSLDRILGLVTSKEPAEETDEQRRKRELDEALGLA